MAHQYQSKFMYQSARPFGEYTFGEYLRPTGFGSYTLGSLSNRPGKDWATPRYVRDEPDKFMSGYGQDEFDEDQGPPQYDPNEGTWTTPGGEVEYDPYDPTSAKTAAIEAAAQAKTPEENAAWTWLKDNATSENLAKGLDLFNKGLATVAQLQQIVKGGGTVPTPPPPQLVSPLPTPVLVDPTLYKGVKKASNDQTMAMLYHRGLVTAAELSANARRMVGLPPLATATSPILLLAGAAVVAFLVLGKKK